MRVTQRHRVERVIAHRIVLDALHRGHALNIDNGGDTYDLSAPSQKVLASKRLTAQPSWK